MKENYEYLNEERFQKNKKKLILVAFLILVIGLSIGGGLIATGLVKHNQLKLNDEEINRIQTEIDDYNNQLASLDAQQHQEFKQNSFSEKYNNLDNQIEKIKDKIEDLEEKMDPDTSYLFVFYMFGGFISIVTLMIAGVVYMSAKRREIAAFTTQQMMPVAQEGIDKMAPTMGNAAEQIAGGIKRGIDNSDNNNMNNNM